MIRILSLNLILMATIGWLTSSVPLMGQEFPVIPVPQKIEAGKGTFLPSTSTQIFVEQRDEAIDWAITYLNGHLQSRLGAALQVRSGKPGAQRGIAIGLDASRAGEQSEITELPTGLSVPVDTEGDQGSELNSGSGIAAEQLNIRTLLPIPYHGWLGHGPSTVVQEQRFRSEVKPALPRTIVTNGTIACVSMNIILTDDHVRQKKSTRNCHRAGKRKHA